MTNQQAKRSLLIQYQRAQRFTEELCEMDIDRLADPTVSHLVEQIRTFDTNIGLTLDRIQATGG